jgi:translation initiation factor 3 subunit K
MTQFPSPQFSLAMHLINPAAGATGELHEAITKLRDLNAKLESARYAPFWAALDGDDLCADLIADIAGFEDLIRERIATQVSQAFREVALPQLEGWLGFNSEEKTRKFASEQGWTVDGDTVKVPRNPDNEAKKAEIREDVKFDMFSRVIKRAWEDTLEK